MIAWSPPANEDRDAIPPSLFPPPAARDEKCMYKRGMIKAINTGRVLPSHVPINRSRSPPKIVTTPPSAFPSSSTSPSFPSSNNPVHALPAIAADGGWRSAQASGPSRARTISMSSPNPSVAFDGSVTTRRPPSERGHPSLSSSHHHPPPPPPSSSSNDSDISLSRHSRRRLPS